eukprot:123016_1
MAIDSLNPTQSTTRSTSMNLSLFTILLFRIVRIDHKTLEIHQTAYNLLKSSDMPSHTTRLGHAHNWQYLVNSNSHPDIICVALIFILSTCTVHGTSNICVQ